MNSKFIPGKDWCGSSEEQHPPERTTKGSIIFNNRQLDRHGLFALQREEDMANVSTSKGKGKAKGQNTPGKSSSKKSKETAENPLLGLEDHLKNASSFFSDFLKLVPQMGADVEDEAPAPKIRNKTLQHQQSLFEKKTKGKIKSDNPSDGFLAPFLQSAKNNAPNADQLKQKLDDRLQQLKRKKGENETPKKGKKEEEEEESKERPKKKQKKQKKSEKEVKVKEEEGEEMETTHTNGTDVALLQEKDEPVEGDFQFGTFDLKGDKAVPQYLVKKKKLKDHVLLKKLEKEKELLEKLKGTPEGEEKIKQIELKRAFQKAQGEKVKDDPKRLKKTMKVTKKKKQKSAEEWAKRKEIQRKEMEERQQKRKQNIRDHLNAKKERRMASRKRKDTKRPGFEGKKRAFLNE